MRAALIVAFIANLVAASSVREGSVFVHGDPSNLKFTFKSGRADTSAAAWGSFDNTVNVTGWGVLDVATQSKLNATTQAYAAGLLEGRLTSELIYQNYLNFMDIIDRMAGGMSDKAWKFLDDQQAWTTTQVKANAGDLRWKVVGAVQAQLAGLVDGYNQAAPHTPLSYRQILFVTAMPDLTDIIPSLHAERRVHWFNMTAEQAELEVARRSFCSAIVKLVPDDLFVAHATWMSYGLMLRIYKHYDFPFFPEIAARKISISSYPGVLASPDDFWMMSSGLAAIETSNNIFDESLYNLIKPQTLLIYQRVRLANMLATTGAEWGAYFSLHNSGTYNNQYMVVDFNRDFETAAGVLTLCEQVPGNVRCADLTNELRSKSYYASYNIPYFPDVWEYLGYQAMVDQYGDDYTYKGAPRARVFANHQASVNDMDGMKRIIRHNEFKDDPIAHGSPFRTICSRGDLGTTAIPQGCLDAKITGASRMCAMTAEVISGPSTASNYPAFEWTAAHANVAHYGQPKTFDFSFVSMQPKQF